MELALVENDDLFGTDVLPDGTVLLNGQYTIERYLSRGGFGITYFARDSLDRRVVIKECFPEAFCGRKNRTVLARSQSYQGEFRSFVEMFVREAHSIAKLNHPNIVGVHQVFQDNETAYMALDLIDGKDLFDIIEDSDDRPTYQDVKPILLALLNAISAVHDQDMLHRDISPDNILINASDTPILIDFGAAREEASKERRVLSTALVVKDGYSPQEFYIAGSQQTPCSDLYALAATFFHFITGEAPPNSQMRLAALASKNPDPYQPLMGRIVRYPAEFLKAIDMAMNIFPQDRIQTARDWILRIDTQEQATQEQTTVALAHAQDDLEIADIVTQLMHTTQQDTEASSSVVAQVSSPEPEGILVASREETSETPLEDLSSKPGLGTRKQVPVAHTQNKQNWIAKCQQKEVQQPRIRKPRPRVAARLVLGAALWFWVLDGHAARFGERVIPVVERMIDQAQKSFGDFA